MTTLSYFDDVDSRGKTRDEFYAEEMEKYTTETCEAFQKDLKNWWFRAEYAIVTSMQFLENSFSAKSLFRHLNLTRLHALAMVATKYDMKDFIEELDAIIEDNAGDAT